MCKTVAVDSQAKFNKKLEGNKRFKDHTSGRVWITPLRTGNLVLWHLLPHVTVSLSSILQHNRYSHFIERFEWSFNLDFGVSVIFLCPRADLGPSTPFVSRERLFWVFSSRSHWPLIGILTICCNHSVKVQLCLPSSKSWSNFPVCGMWYSFVFPVGCCSQSGFAFRELSDCSELLNSNTSTCVALYSVLSHLKPGWQWNIAAVIMNN